LIRQSAPLVVHWNAERLSQIPAIVCSTVARASNIIRPWYSAEFHVTFS